MAYRAFASVTDSKQAELPSSATQLDSQQASQVTSAPMLGQPVTEVAHAAHNCVQDHGTVLAAIYPFTATSCAAPSPVDWWLPGQAVPCAAACTPGHAAPSPLAHMPRCSRQGHEFPFKNSADQPPPALVGSYSTQRKLTLTPQIRSNSYSTTVELSSSCESHTAARQTSTAGRKQAEQELASHSQL